MKCISFMLHSGQRAMVQWRSSPTGIPTSPSTWSTTTLPGSRAPSHPLWTKVSPSHQTRRQLIWPDSIKGSQPWCVLRSHLSPDVKFDAVSGDYYPIVYFNDYWNLQKDYYPINETLTTLPLRLAYCPLSLWRWQLYAAQNARSPWNFLPEDTYEQSDEDQDSVKVSKWLLSASVSDLNV